MKKIFKILLNILSGILIVAITVPIILSFVLRLNPVQNFLLKRATTFATEYIGSPVTIGNIKFHNIYNVELGDIYVKDPRLNDTLLYVKHLNAEFSGYNIANSKMVFDRAYIKDGLYTHYQYEDSTSNVKQIIDIIRKGKQRDEKSKSTKILINDITLDSVTFRLKKEVPISVEYGINFTDMSLDHISGNVDFLEIDGVDITGRVNNVSLKEKNNIAIKNLDVKNFLVSPSKMRYENVTAMLGRSDLDVRYYEMTYQNWVLQDYINLIHMSADVNNSKVYLDDVAKFTREYRKWKSIVDISASFSGTVSDFKGDIRKIKSQNTTIDGGSYHISGIPILDSMHFDITIDTIQTSTVDVHSIVNDFAAKESLSFLKELSLQPTINASGSFDGKLSDMKIDAIFSAVNTTGTGSTNIQVTRMENGTGIKGDISLTDINPNDYYPVKEVTLITTHAEVDGIISPESLSMHAKARIDSIELLNIRYDKIDIDGRIENKIFLGAIISRDKNINFDFNGQIDMSKDKPTYNAYLDLHKIDLFHFNLFKHDSLLNASAKIVVSGAGKDFKDIQITSKIDDLTIINSQDTISPKTSIDISINNNPELNSLSIKSDFMDIGLRGVADFQTIKNYIEESLSSYLPMIVSDSTSLDSTINLANVHKKSSPLKIEDYYIAEVNIKQHTKLIDAFIPNLIIAEGTKVLFMFNPYKKTYSFNVNSELISYNNNMISSLAISSTSKDESISLYATAEELLYNNLYVPNLSIINNINKDKMSTSIGFTNTINESKMLIKSKGIISRAPETNKININTTILPSYFSMGKKQWDILSGEINTNSDRIHIDSLSIVSEAESLLMDGYLSKSASDSLSINLFNFNVAIISVLTEKIGFAFQGNLSGKASFIAGLSKDKRELKGELEVMDLLVNNAKVPESKVVMALDKTSMINKINLIDNKTHALLVDGSLSWIKNEFSFDFLFNDFSPILITPFLNGIASDVGGNIDVELNLSNKNKYRKTILNGNLDIENFYATIDYTKVKYNTSGKMTIKDNLFEINNVTVSDEDGGSGNLSVMLNIHRTKGFLFDIGVKSIDLMALNTKQVDNSIFYGNVYVSGDVDINNTDLTGVKLIAKAKTAKKSKFYLPLSHNSNISDADYISYVKQNIIDTVKNTLWDIHKNKRKTITSIAGFDFKLNLSVLEDAEMEIVIDPSSGSTINGFGRGDIFMHVNPDEDIFTINGEYIISKGTYKFILPTITIINKVFNITEGSWIKFNGDPMTESTLDVTAVYKIKASIAPLLTGSEGEQFAKRVEVDCIMNIKDNLMKPNIVLGVDVQNTDPETEAVVRSVLNTPEAISNQFALLLISSSFMTTDMDSESTAANIGITTGIEFFTNKIRDIISSDKFDFSLNYMPRDRSGITSDEVSLGISVPIYRNRVFLDVEGNFNFMNNDAAIASPNLNKVSGGFNITWALNESGNLLLKGFSRTIDTFDENQGFQESGAGVYFKEEFDNIGELEQKYKEYIEERKVKRAERKAKRKLKKEKKEKEKLEKESNNN